MWPKTLTGYWCYYSRKNVVYGSWFAQQWCKGNKCPDPTTYLYVALRLQMVGAVSPLPSVPSCVRRTLPVIYFVLDLTSLVDCEKCVSPECTFSSFVL